MPDKAKHRRTPKGIGRFRIGFNVLVQLVLVLFLVALVNSFAFKHYARWDLSRDQKYALSDKTKRFLDTLKGKMRITVFFSPSTPITADVQNLLTEYQYAGKGKIDVEHIDPDRNLSRAKELFDKYKVVTDESLLVLDYDGRNKTVKASEMADVDQSGMAFGEGPRVAAFKGEQAITSAMMDLVEGKKKILGYVTGHKEPSLSEGTSPISVLKRGFANELGVKMNDDRLMAFLRTGIQELALTRDVQARFLGDSPITKRLADARALFLGGTSSITVEPDRVRAANIRVEQLIQAEKGYFAEKDYNTDDQVKLQADAKQSNASLTIGAAVEKGGSADQRVQVNSSRLVVVSNASFVQDNAITQDQQGLDFVSGSVNWLLSREQLIGIAPKVPKPLTFSLNEEALRRLRWFILVFIPLVPALIGTMVWWQRRV